LCLGEKPGRGLLPAYAQRTMARGTGAGDCGQTRARGGFRAFFDELAAAQPEPTDLYTGEIPEVENPSFNKTLGYSMVRRDDGTILLVTRRPFSDGASTYVEGRSIFADETELRRAVARHEAKTVIDDPTLDALVLERLRADGPEIAWAILMRLSDDGYFAGETRNRQGRVSRSLQRLAGRGLTRFRGSRWELAPDPRLLATGIDLEIFELVYHIPRSQVWEGSRGGQHGNTHLHVRADFDSGRIHRRAGQALCGKDGWMPRPPEYDSEFSDLCPRCVEIANR
jgi:hypothetical protein